MARAHGRGTRRLAAGALATAALAVNTAWPSVAAAGEPPADCLAARSEDWTAQEAWVWERLCLRDVADLGEAGRFGTAGEVDSADGWSRERIIRAAFLEEVLMEPGLAGHLSNRKIQIEGAWIREAVDLEGGSVESPLYVFGSRFESDVVMQGLRTTGNVGLDGSSVSGTFTVDGASIGGSLFLRDAAVNEVDATAADIAGGVELVDSTFSGVVGLANVDVGGAVYLSRATFRERVTMTTTDVAGSVEMFDAVVHKEFQFRRAQIQGSLVIAGSEVEGELNLAGTRIGGSLALAVGERVTRWGPDGSIRLRGASAGGIDDSTDAWPPAAHLEGFTLTQPHGYASAPTDDAFDGREVDWYVDWLDRGDSFSRGAYLHVEQLLRASGRQEAADDMGVARKDREADASGPGAQVVAFVYRWTVGYGYHPERAAYWALLLIVVGWGVAQRIPQAEMDDKGVTSRAVLSAQRLIPLVSFGEAYSKVDTTSRAAAPVVRGYFYVHVLLGYVLAAALVAAVTSAVSTG